MMRHAIYFAALLAGSAGCATSTAENKRPAQGSTVTLSVTGLHDDLVETKMHSSTLVATVTEGTTSDAIEFGLAGNEDSDKLDLTLFLAANRSAGLTSLNGEFALGPPSHDAPSQLRVALGDHEYLSSSGQVSVQRLAKSLSGTFSAQLEPVSDSSLPSRALSGSFAGPLAVRCFVRTTADMNSGVITDTPDSLTLAGPEHPFCARFAP
jgi:hypothetical protein